MKRFELDVTRVLLGSLAHAQLLKGLATLGRIEAVLAAKYDLKQLTALSSEFYTEASGAARRSPSVAHARGTDPARVWSLAAAADRLAVQSRSQSEVRRAASRCVVKLARAECSTRSSTWRARRA